MTDPYVCHINGLPHLPSIYPSHVSINLPFTYGSVMGTNWCRISQASTVERARHKVFVVSVAVIDLDFKHGPLRVYDSWIWHIHRKHKNGDSNYPQASCFHYSGICICFKCSISHSFQFLNASIETINPAYLVALFSTCPALSIVSPVSPGEFFKGS